MAISLFRGKGRKVQEDRSVLFLAQQLGPKTLSMANAYAGALADVLPEMFSGIAQSPVMRRFASEVEKLQYKEAMDLRPKKLDHDAIRALTAEQLKTRSQNKAESDRLYALWREQYGAAYDARLARRAQFIEQLKKTSVTGRPILIEAKQTGLVCSTLDKAEHDELIASKMAPAAPYVAVQRGALRDSDRLPSAYEYGTTHPRDFIAETVYKDADNSATKLECSGRVGYAIMAPYNAASWPKPTE